MPGISISIGLSLFVCLLEKMREATNNTNTTTAIPRPHHNLGWSKRTKSPLPKVRSQKRKIAHTESNMTLNILSIIRQMEAEGAQ